jgi:hypothetical protein
MDCVAESISGVLAGPGGYASLASVGNPAARNPTPRLDFRAPALVSSAWQLIAPFAMSRPFRRAPGAQLEFAAAGPGNTVDVLGYQNFLTACARDSRFSGDGLLPAMEQEVHLSWLDRLIYRYAIIPFLKKSLLRQAEQFKWTGQHERPPWGPGRIDPFNPVKFGMLRLADDGTIGNSDMLAVWNLGARDEVRADAPLHWDGLNTSVREVVLSSALGDGMTRKNMTNRPKPRCAASLLFCTARNRRRPPYRPDPAAVNRGHLLYVKLCAQCHAVTGARTLTVIPVEEVQTDRRRIDMWTPAARDAYNHYRTGY